MRILFIYPNPYKSSPPSGLVKILNVFFNFPISTFEALENVTPKEHSIDVINELTEPINFEEDYDIVGISAMTNQAPRAYTIANEFRKRGKKVVLGGWHPSALPDEAIQHADSIIMGMAETSWSCFLEDLEKEKMKPIYDWDTSFNMADIPNIRRDLIKHNPILGAVQSTRGCSNKCEFCAISSFCHHGVRQRPIKNVVEEIMQMPNKMFVIHDPHLTINHKYAMELFKELIRQGVNKSWVANGTTNVLLKADGEFLDLIGMFHPGEKTSDVGDGLVDRIDGEGTA